MEFKGENTKIPKKLLDLNKMPFEHLLYMKYRHKSSDELQFLLKYSPVVGFDVKCQLCKKLFKVAELRAHFSTLKHVKKMNEVAELHYNQEERIWQLIARGNASQTERYRRHCAISFSREVNNKDESKSSTDKPVESEFTLVVKSNNKTQIAHISEDFPNSTKKTKPLLEILDDVCKNKLNKVHAYDVDSSWIVVLLVVEKKFVWSLHKKDIIETSYVMEKHLANISVAKKYCSTLKSLHSSIIVQPAIQLFNRRSNYKLWTNYNIEDKQHQDCLENKMTEIIKQMEPDSETKLINLYLDFMPKINLTQTASFEFCKYEMWKYDQLKMIKSDKMISPAFDVQEKIQISESICNVEERPSIEVIEDTKSIFANGVPETIQSAVDGIKKLKSLEDPCNNQENLSLFQVTEKIQNIFGDEIHETSNDADKFSLLACSVKMNSVELVQPDTENKLLNLYLDFISTNISYQMVRLEFCKYDMWKHEQVKMKKSNGMISPTFDVQEKIQSPESVCNAEKLPPIKVKENRKGLFANEVPETILSAFDGHERHLDPYNNQENPSLFKVTGKIQNNFVGEIHQTYNDENKLSSFANSEKLSSVEMTQPYSETKLINLYLDFMPKDISHQTKFYKYQSWKHEQVQMNNSDRMILPACDNQENNLSFEGTCKVQEKSLTLEGIEERKSVFAKKVPEIIPSTFDEQENLKSLEDACNNKENRFPMEVNKNIQNMLVETHEFIPPVQDDQDIMKSLEGACNNRDTLTSLADSEKMNCLLVDEIPETTTLFVEEQAQKSLNVVSNNVIEGVSTIKGSEEKNDMVINEIHPISQPSHDDQEKLQSLKGPCYDQEKLSTFEGTKRIPKLVAHEMHETILSGNYGQEKLPSPKNECNNQESVSSLEDTKVRKNMLRNEIHESIVPPFDGKEKLKRSERVCSDQDNLIPSQSLEERNHITNNIRESVPLSRKKPQTLERKCNGQKKRPSLEGPDSRKIKFTNDIHETKLPAKNGPRKLQSLLSANYSPEKLPPLEGTEKSENMFVSPCDINLHSHEERHTLEREEIVKELPKKLPKNKNATTKIPQIDDPYSLDKNYDLLEINDLLKIKYKTGNSSLRYMFLKNEKSISCLVCKSDLSTVKANILNHILGARHGNHITRKVAQLSHPAVSRAELNYGKDMFKIFVDLIDFLSKPPSHSLEEFIETMKLSITDLMNVEISTPSGQWVLMLTFNNNEYSCNLCNGIKMKNQTNVRQHCQSEPHIKNAKIMLQNYENSFCSSSDAPLKTESIQVEKKENNKSKQKSLVQNSMQEISSNSSEKIDKKAEKENDTHKLQKTCVLEDQDKEVISPHNLSLANFKQNYIHMTISDLLKTEYRSESKEWKFMILKNGSQYICNLCDEYPLANSTSVTKHLKSASHSKTLKAILEIKHPYYCITTAELKTATKKGNKKSKNDPKNIPKTKDCQPTSKLKEFKRTYLRLKSKKILGIQYKLASADWRHMLMIKEGLYYCNLCNGLPLGKSSNIKSHLNAKPHVKNMSDIENLYHPTNFSDASSHTPKPLSDSIEEYVNGTRLSTSYEIYIPVEKESGSDAKVENPPNISQENGKLKNESDEKVSGQEEILKTLSLEEFKQSYKYLPADELLKLEYKKTPSSDWSLMIHENPVKYRCNLCCRMKLKDKKDVKAHLNGSFHVLNMESIKAMYNPKHHMLQNNSLKNQDKNKSLELTPEHRLEEFKVKYAEMKLENILKVQFKTSGNTWQYLIEQEEIRYLCVLCWRLSLKTKDDICSHIRTNHHCDNMKPVSALHHPICFPSKDSISQIQKVNSQSSISEGSRTSSVINGVLKLISEHETRCKNAHCDLDCAQADFKSRANSIDDYDEIVDALKNRGEEIIDMYEKMKRKQYELMHSIKSPKSKSTSRNQNLPVKDITQTTENGVSTSNMCLIEKNTDNIPNGPKTNDSSVKNSLNRPAIPQANNGTLNKYDKEDPILKILRHISALENLLGSLGPVSTELLSKIVKLHKEGSHYNLSSDDILLLEMIQEKFLGLIEIDFLNPHETSSVKQVLIEIKTFINNYADSFTN